MDNRKNLIWHPTYYEPKPSEKQLDLCDVKIVPLERYFFDKTLYNLSIQSGPDNFQKF